MIGPQGHLAPCVIECHGEMAEKDVPNAACRRRNLRNTWPADRGQCEARDSLAADLERMVGRQRFGHLPADSDPLPGHCLRVACLRQQSVRGGILRIQMSRAGVASVNQKTPRWFAVHRRQNGRHSVFQLNRHRTARGLRRRYHRWVGERQRLLGIVNRNGQPGEQLVADRAVYLPTLRQKPRDHRVFDDMQGQMRQAHGIADFKCRVRRKARRRRAAISESRQVALRRQPSDFRAAFGHKCRPRAAVQ